MEHNISGLNISNEERINILIQEYNTLREEEFHYIDAVSNWFIIFVTIFTGIIGLSLEYDNIDLYYTIPILELILFTELSNLLFAIRLFAKNIHSLEMKINDIAGEKLLQWHSSNLTFYEIDHRVSKSAKKDKWKYLISKFYTFHIFFFFCSLILLVWGTIDGYDKLKIFLIDRNINSILSWIYPIFVILYSVVLIFIEVFRLVTVLPTYLEILNKIRGISIQERIKTRGIFKFQ